MKKPSPLSTLLTPSSVAIVGASRDPHKIGHIVLKNILSFGFKGKIFPLNPHETEPIEGLPVFPDYTHLPEVPDLALIAIPAALVLTELEKIAEAGTRNVLIFSAGFKESDAEGQERERDLVALIKKYKLNCIGPNCLGLVNTAHHLNATFGEAPQMLGNIRFISQSGAIASSLFDWAETTGVGFQEFITLGNKATLGENDLLEYFISLPSPTAPLEPGLSAYQPIGLYLESITDGQAFVRVAKKIAQHNPLFILKPGKSAAAQHAMHSHTGAMANDDAVLNAALETAGVIRCEGTEDLFDLARALSWENAPEGPRVAIVSNAGGPGVVSTDSISAEGLELAPIDSRTKGLLTAHLPRAASILNPIDVLGDALADRYGNALEAVLKEKAVDAVLVILTPQIMTQIKETAALIGQLSAQYGKPIMCSFMGGKLISEGETILNSSKIPSFRFPERAIKTLAKMWRWKKWQKNTFSLSAAPTITDAQITASQHIFHAAKKKNQNNLSSLEAGKLLKIYRIDTPPTRLVKNLKEAHAFTKKAHWPVVLKISSPEILHKTEMGGVIVNISNLKELTAAFKNLQSKLTSPADAIQIQKQVEKGVELIVGVKRDSSFGEVLMFGAGGTLAELVLDRNLLLLPAGRAEIERLVSQSKIFQLLQGFRGEKPFALDAIYTLIENLATMALHNADWKEIEINPAIVTHQKAWAVDGKVVLN